MQRQFILSVILLIFSCLMMQGCMDQSDHLRLETGTVSDIEGNVYKTVKIGDQWWMAENLRVTSFSSGTQIDLVDQGVSWMTTEQPAYSTYNNASGYGLLYNFYVIRSQEEIAPEGWRVPTDEDWKTLEAYIGMSAGDIDQINWRGVDEGDLLKEKTTNTTGWVSYDSVWGTDTYGFNATGGSCRVYDGVWGIPGLRHSGYWWTSTSTNGYGWFRSLDYKKSGIFRYNAEPTYGFSIRCVKN